MMRIWCLTDGEYGKELEDMIDSVQGIDKEVQIELVNAWNVVPVMEESGKYRIYRDGAPAELPDVLWNCDGSAVTMDIAKFIESAGVYAFNPSEAVKSAADKMMTYHRLAKAGAARMIQTALVSCRTDPSALIGLLGLPMVVKPRSGFGGRGVELVHTEEELSTFLRSLTKEEGYQHIAQNFITSSMGRDLRVTCLYGKPIFGIRRFNDDPNEFRSNVKAGASYEFIEIEDEEIRSLSWKIAKASGLDLCGIDLLYSPEGYILTEINSSPGFLDRFPVYAPMIFEEIRKHCLEADDAV
jgi:RimK family alpha-L-glutamate ligase